jgi:hypothetical protein
MPELNIQELNYNNLSRGLNFIFVGPQTMYKNIISQSNNRSDVYIVDSLDYQYLTDKFIDEQALVIIDKQDDIIILEVINFPDIKLDWLSAIDIYIANNENHKPINKLYKWGQITNYTTEAMCNNCGYIDNIHQGESYPICPVCLSGLPHSPCEPDQEFWVNLN